MAEKCLDGPAGQAHRPDALFRLRGREPRGCALRESGGLQRPPDPQRIAFEVYILPREVEKLTLPESGGNGHNVDGAVAVLGVRGRAQERSCLGGGEGRHLPPFERVAVQCKNYGKAVGNKPIQEVYAGSRFHGCNDAWVVAPARLLRAR